MINEIQPKIKFQNIAQCPFKIFTMWWVSPDYITFIVVSKAFWSNQEINFTHRTRCAYLSNKMTKILIWVKISMEYCTYSYLLVYILPYLKLLWEWHPHFSEPCFFVLFFVFFLCVFFFDHTRTLCKGSDTSISVTKWPKNINLDENFNRILHIFTSALVGVALLCCCTFLSPGCVWQSHMGFCKM